ncbi:hypothetical protein [Lactobacillus panisapium]|uniref:Transposase n=1 Tax=Lactobacillus panisapium TaxID=2012495 RepID=A0ABX8WA47_9LACO|nr:hypothetical protein [Lactobacillus panisapium]QYN53068.1 hypothetical protein GYM71_06385 [Lactobacillus panisapium]
MNSNEKAMINRYRKDKRKIENDWRKVNKDMWRLIKYVQQYLECIEQ